MDEAGCSQPYLSLLEAGKRKVGPRYLFKMAAALGVSPQELRPDLALYFAGSRSDTLQHVNNGADIQGQPDENAAGAA